MTNTLNNLAIIMSLLIAGAPAAGQDFNTHKALPYLLEKLRSHQIVLMGTIHQNPQILELTSQLLPLIKDAGVTDLAIEVSSDQQGKIDRFMQDGNGLADIELHHSIDCRQYRRLFTIIRELPARQRPRIVAVDLPPKQYSGSIGRDTYMANTLASMFQSRPDRKILAIMGSLHVLKKLDWLPRITNRQPSIRSLLEQRQPPLTMFSLVHLISDDSSTSIDIRNLVDPVKGAVAMDLDERMSEWRLGLTDCLAVRPRPANELVDGIIFH